MTALSELKLSDAVLQGFRTDGGDLLVEMIDWQEKPLRIRFEDVLAVEACAALGAELSHGSESSNDPWIADVAHRIGEDLRDSQCFAIHGAWDENPVLRVIARSVSVA